MKKEMLEVIQSRRAVRSYTAEKLTQEEVAALVDVALLSPSARNLQPWHLTVVEDTDLILQWEKEIIQYFVDAGDTQVVESNKARNNKIFYDAPAVFVISMEQDKGMDVGIMAQSIALAARAMGLDSVILGFPRVVFSPENNRKWETALRFPEGYFFGIALSVGHGAAPGLSRTGDNSKVTYLK